MSLPLRAYTHERFSRELDVTEANLLCTVKRQEELAIMPAII